MLYKCHKQTLAWLTCGLILSGMYHEDYYLSVSSTINPGEHGHDVQHKGQ